MDFIRAALVLVLVAAALMSPGVAAAQDNIKVQTDRATVIRLVAKTTTVIVGNPSIADISLQKNGSVVVTGKSYGTTNLISQDATGAVISEQLIRVEAADDGQMVVQRGMERETYSCTPRCQPTLSLGDVPKHFDSAAAQANARNSLAK
jgi:hypothetical protein